MRTGKPEECAHASKAEIEADRENLKDSVFRIKHGAEWLNDAGASNDIADMRTRGLESPDRADALIGAITLAIIGGDGAVTARELAVIQSGRAGGPAACEGENYWLN